MKNIVPKDSRYIPLTQQRWCCVPTCIQMIMLRLRIPLVSAELIGFHMGLVIPEDGKKYFWNSRSGPKPSAGYGTQAGRPQFGPNAVFRKLKIPLKMSWSLIDKFKNFDDFRKYLEDISNSDNDILVCFDWSALFDPDNKNHWGHVCVLDKVDLKKDEVRIIDPEYDAPKWRIIKMKKLYDSMRYHGKEKSGGFWEFNKI